MTIKAPEQTAPQPAVGKKKPKVDLENKWKAATNGKQSVWVHWR